MKETPATTYQCLFCGSPFTVEQGSRQKYCPECIVKRLKKGGRKGGLKKAENTPKAKQ